MSLMVRPLRREWIEALIEGDAEFSQRFRLEVAPGWAGFPEALPAALGAARRTDADPWGSYLFFEDDVLVGFGGFKGSPRQGQVEIGYAIAPSRQGQGLAGEAVRTLVEWARSAPDVETVVAHTLAERNASVSVLERAGFARTIVDGVGQGVDGSVWRWELRMGN